MLLDKLRKDKSKQFSGRATRLASCLFNLTVWTRVTISSVLITAPCEWKTKVSSYHLKLTNKIILLQYPATKTGNLIGVYRRSDWHDIPVHLSLTHSSIDPLKTYPKRGTEKNTHGHTVKKPRADMYNITIDLPSLRAELLGWVVQSQIKLTQDKQEFWYEFCTLTVRFSAYGLAFCFEFE